MAARTDCRHYAVRTLASGDKVERCKIDVATITPFDCPEDCLFFEPRPPMSAGWTVGGTA
jgi:hypothetical protein